MTKIDETKKFKFSDIVRMLEDNELPELTKVRTTGHKCTELVVKADTDNDLSLYHSLGAIMPTAMLTYYFMKNWIIELPEEVKYYLKAPKLFSVGSSYLQYNSQTRAYSLNSYGEPFTQSEIDSMPFDTNFFEKVKQNKS